VDAIADGDRDEAGKPRHVEAEPRAPGPTVPTLRVESPGPVLTRMGTQRSTARGLVPLRATSSLR
jgi:hypothetical protein